MVRQPEVSKTLINDNHELLNVQLKMKKGNLNLMASNSSAKKASKMQTVGFKDKFIPPNAPQ